MTAVNIGTNCCLSLTSCVKLHATMICDSLSTAICALYDCSKLPVALSFMIRDSGSVKFRWALASGFAASTSGTCGTRPGVFLPVSSSRFWRASSLAWATAAAALAFSFASASKAAFASRIFCKRLSRRANSCGNSSPRRPLPNS